jgi:hypothetical protein
MIKSSQERKKWTVSIAKEDAKGINLKDVAGVFLGDFGG